MIINTKPFEKPIDNIKEEKPKFNKVKDVTCFKCQRKDHYANECLNERKVFDKKVDIIRSYALLNDGGIQFLSDSEHEYDDDEHDGDGFGFDDGGDDDDDDDDDDGREVDRVGEIEDELYMVAMRSLSALKEEDVGNDRVKEQRENLFHTKCKIMGLTSSVIVENSSCTNAVSWHVVDK